MALNPHEQFNEAARQGEKILLALPHAAGVDEVGAGLALAAMLRRLGKSVDLISDGFSERPEHRILADVGSVRPELGGLQNFVITLPLKDTELENLSYTCDQRELKITVTPKDKNWEAHELKAAPSRFRYDLAVTVGASDLDALGRPYRETTDFWLTVPILNLDRSPENERFGAVNLVNISAASVSEVAYDLILECEPAALDKQTATSLLAGIIAKTKNFRTENVSPKTLTVAADLVYRGADRERIVAELYSTRSIETLRLWGRALARLKADSQNKIIWTLLTRQDFVAAGAKEEELRGVMEELIAASPDAQAAFVLYECSKGVCGIIQSAPGIDLLALCRDWSPQGTGREVEIKITNTPIIDAERALLERLRRQK